MKITYLFIFFCIIFSCKENYTKKIITINIIRISKVTNQKYNNESFYVIKFSIKNNSDSIIRYWSETALWQENWIFNNEKVNFVYPLYENNGPIIRELKSKGIITISDTICVLKDLFSKNRPYIKIGFIFINSSNANNFNDAMFLIERSRKYHENVFWSDSIKLP